MDIINLVSSGLFSRLKSTHKHRAHQIW